jgi:hypothetical protein
MIRVLERLVVATDVSQEEHVPVTLVGDAVVSVDVRTLIVSIFALWLDILTFRRNDTTSDLNCKEGLL